MTELCVAVRWLSSVWLCDEWDLCGCAMTEFCVAVRWPSSLWLCDECSHAFFIYLLFSWSKIVEADFRTDAKVSVGSVILNPLLVEWANEFISRTPHSAKPPYWLSLLVCCRKQLWRFRRQDEVQLMRVGYWAPHLQPFVSDQLYTTWRTLTRTVVPIFWKPNTF